MMTIIKIIKKNSNKIMKKLKKLVNQIAVMMTILMKKKKKNSKSKNKKKFVLIMNIYPVKNYKTYWIIKQLKI